MALIGNAGEDGRQLFILQVEDKTNQKLLYRGPIWVEVKDYAVVRIDFQPAERPVLLDSEHRDSPRCAKVGDFSLRNGT